MRKAGAFFILLFFGLGLLYAQEEDDEPDYVDPPIISDWDIYVPELYTYGDQAFIITLGLIFPTVFVNDGKVIDHNFSPPVGGTGSLSYNFFLSPNIFLGGEISGMFNSTLGNNTVFMIPLGVRMGYQFILWRFEFPLTMTLGINWHRYLNLGYFGFYMKGGGSVYFRLRPEWSIGVNANWCWFPEWTEDRSKNVDGNIMELTFSVRYHF
ncbi:MAG: hypothetical protein FWG99_00820 [Treponema sp.]|nr:hypothetical protein [Treponema sp.]